MLLYIVLMNDVLMNRVDSDAGRSVHRPRGMIGTVNSLNNVESTMKKKVIERIEQNIIQKALNKIDAR